MSTFALGQRVEIINTGEQGEVVGRQERLDAPTSYLVRYTPADGGPEHDRWIEEQHISAA